MLEHFENGSLFFYFFFFNDSNCFREYFFYICVVRILFDNFILVTCYYSLFLKPNVISSRWTIYNSIKPYISIILKFNPSQNEKS